MENDRRSFLLPMNPKNPVTDERVSPVCPPGAVHRRFLLLGTVLSLWLGGCAGEEPFAIYENSVGLEMLPIAPGRFVMGSPMSEGQREMHETPHAVQITRPFFLAATELTRGQWADAWDEPPPGEGLGGLPVENLTFFDAVRFCNRLSEIEGRVAAYRVDGMNVEWDTTASGYRLPTEAEWEFAARAGSTTAFWSGRQGPGTLEGVAWCETSAGGRARAVGTTVANPWGLYDVHGNAWEWCWDLYGPYAASPAVDPLGARTGQMRVLRGGAWHSAPRLCRSAYRYPRPMEVETNYVGLGLRLARSR